MRKYRNKPCIVDGLKFDSIAEAARWGSLQLMQDVGMIRGLERQVPYVLVPSVKFDGSARAKPAVKLTVDFVYWEGEKRVLEDTKGIVTDIFRLKQHLLKSVHGLEVRLTK